MILRIEIVVDDGTKLKIIKEELGKNTGDVLFQTEDGRWWKVWDGIIRTGQDIKTKTDGHLE